MSSGWNSPAPAPSRYEASQLGEDVSFICPGDPNGGCDFGGDGDGTATTGDGTQCPCENLQDGIYVLNSNSPPSVWFCDGPS